MPDQPQPFPNTDTQICISIAARPGKLGTTIHNAGYRALGLNFIYKSLKVEDLEGAIRGIRALGIRGCSVTMPFKEKVIHYLDEIDDLAKQVNAVNTIVNQNGILKGYNTDVNGAHDALKGFQLKPDIRALILGAGGAASAIIAALVQLGINDITITSRRREAAQTLAQKTKYKTIPWEQRETHECDILLNATPVGMAPQDNETPVSTKNLKKYKLIFDAVAVPPVSKLIRETRAQNIPAIDGFTMNLCQAYEQFRLYTGHSAPIEAMKQAAQQLLANN